MRDRLQLVDEGFQRRQEINQRSGEALLDVLEKPMQDLADHYWDLGDRSAAFGLSIKHEQIKKAHAAHEKGQKS